MWYNLYYKSTSEIKKFALKAFKQKFFKIGSFLLFFAILAGIFSPVFAASGVALGDIQFSVTASAKPGSPNTFHLFGLLDKPASIRTGSNATVISLGSDKTDVVTGLGFGVMRKSDLSSRCKEQDGGWFCNFPLTYKSSGAQFSKLEPLTADVQLSQSDIELLGFTAAASLRDEALVVMPYVNLQNNPSPAVFSSQATLPVFPENIVVGSNTANRDGSFKSIAPSGQVLAEEIKDGDKPSGFYRYFDDEIKWSNSLDKNFIRTYPGDTINFTATLRLTAPQVLHLASKGGSGDTLRFRSGNKDAGILYQLLMGGIVQGQKDKLCPPGPNCTFSISSTDAGYGGSLTSAFNLSVGSDYTFHFSTNKLAFADGQTSPYLIKLDMIPVLKTKGGSLFGASVGDSNDVPYTGVAKTMFLQMYKTQAERDAAVAKNDPIPPEVGTNTSVDGTGAQDNVEIIQSKLVQAINTIIATVIGLIQEILVWIFSYTVGPFIEAMLSIHTYTDKFADVIYPAWQIFRNLGNIFFILIMVAIGLGTVFRVGGWQAKDLLVKLILGAIFINFSLLIAQSILGIADTIQNQFLPNNTGAIRLLADQLIGSKTLTDDLNQLPASAFGTFGETVRLFTLLIVSFAAFVAFVGIAGLLLIRVVFLWLLLMLSPLPYIAMVLPATKKISKRWWNNFIKYAFMTPAAAFMLNLTALIADKQRDVIQRLSEGAVSNADGLIRVAYAAGNTDPALVKVMYAVASNAVLIVFMFMALKVGSAFGAESGHLIEKMDKKTMSAATWLPRKAAEKGQEKFDNTRYSLANKWKPMELKDDDGFLKRQGKKALNFVGANGYQNVLTGGGYSKAKQEARKADLEGKKEKSKANIKDFRAAQAGKPVNSVKRLEASKRAKAVKEVEDQIRDVEEHDSPQKATDALNKLSGGQREHELEAWIGKALKDGNLQDIMNNALNRDPAGRGDPPATIEEYFNKLQTKGVGKEAIQRYAKNINSSQAEKGNLQYVTDTEDYTNTTANEARRELVWKGKTPAEMAKINKAQYKDATGVSKFLVEFASNFDDIDDARRLRGNMKPGNRTEFKTIVNDATLEADLQSKLSAQIRGRNPGMTAGAADIQADAIISNIKRVM